MDTGKVVTGTVILGIESSCDETAAAVVMEGATLASSIVASQIEIHHRYGGVVPELASRKHIEAIVPVVEETLDKADMSLRDITAIAVTCAWSKITGLKLTATPTSWPS